MCSSGCRSTVLTEVVSQPCEAPKGGRHGGPGEQSEASKMREWREGGREGGLLHMSYSLNSYYPP